MIQHKAVGLLLIIAAWQLKNVSRELHVISYRVTCIKVWKRIVDVATVIPF